jgi:uncharacterized protein YyaL (SSP411 family)
MSKSSVSAVLAFATDARHSHGRDDHYCTGGELLSIYALLNRIRLCASDAVLGQAVEVVKFIMEQYFAPNVSVEEFHERVHNGGIDPLKAFSEACRAELRSLHTAF